MNPSPLILRHYFTTDLSFSANTGFDVEKGGSLHIWSDDLDVKVTEWQVEENTRRRGCKIRVELKRSAEKIFPYEFTISLVGFFEIASWWPPEQVDNLFSANAPAVLYSSARETLAMVTGRGPYPGIMLPTVTFIKLPDETKKENKGLPASNEVEAPEISIQQESSTDKKKLPRKIKNNK